MKKKIVSVLACLLLIIPLQTVSGYMQNINTNEINDKESKNSDAEIIALTLDEKGIPNDAASRGEMALIMITKAMESGIPTDNIFLDPLILPVGAAQDQGKKVLESLDMFKTLCDPAPKTVVGLSNISNNTKQRPLINRTYLIMLMAHGLDAAIMDPGDAELMNAVKTSEILLNKKLYADDFLKI